LGLFDLIDLIDLVEPFRGYMLVILDNFSLLRKLLDLEELMDFNNGKGKVSI